MEKLKFNKNIYVGINFNDLAIPKEALYSRDKDKEIRFRKEDSPLSFNDLSSVEQETLVHWCYELEPIKSFNDKRTSYGLKHIYERTTGNYVGNGAFKGAMLLVGFKVKNLDSLNWIFNVSERYIQANF